VIERLALVRHGETLHNVAGIAQGWQDSELSDRGRTQVERVARRLGTMGCDALFSSTLNRALSTAQAISDVTGLPIQTVDDLREMNYGTWEGKSFLEVRKTDEPAYLRWIDDVDYPCPEGESHAHVLERMKRAFDSVRASGAKRPIVVSHGTAIRIGATALLDAPLEMSRHFAQDNAALNLFVWRGERCIMKLWNDTTHWNDER
jgi:ribonuclease H / adenosylcobalamin/alpha-ribazole phosphatase